MTEIVQMTPFEMVTEYSRFKRVLNTFNLTESNKYLEKRKKRIPTSLSETSDIRLIKKGQYSHLNLSIEMIEDAMLTVEKNTISQLVSVISKTSSMNTSMIHLAIGKLFTTLKENGFDGYYLYDRDMKNKIIKYTFE